GRGGERGADVVGQLEGWLVAPVEDQTSLRCRGQRRRGVLVAEAEGRIADAGHVVLLSWDGRLVWGQPTHRPVAPPAPLGAVPHTFRASTTLTDRLRSPAPCREPDAGAGRALPPSRSHTARSIPA